MTEGLGRIMLAAAAVATLCLVLLSGSAAPSPPRRRRLSSSPADTGERVWFVRHFDSSRTGSREDAAGGAGSNNGVGGGWRCPDGRLLEDPVVVVGTDGSGTRVVAKLLAKLNVTVLVERAVYGQMDVDGAAAGVHFTATIQKVLAGGTGSPAYRPAPAPTGDLPAPVAREARALVAAFAASMRANACAAGLGAGGGAEDDQRIHGDQRIYGGRPALSPPRGAAWAFKKPDLMNLLPFLADEFPDLQVPISHPPTRVPYRTKRGVRAGAVARAVGGDEETARVRARGSSSTDDYCIWNYRRRPHWCQCTPGPVRSRTRFRSRDRRAGRDLAA